MFKNPLKYQQGGSTQDAMQQLVAWLVQNTGLDEGQISQRLNQILNDDTAKQELVNNLQSMQNGDQKAAERIKSMFVPQSAKFGGKIQDFICKHAKGGKAGCGCKKQNGGQMGTGLAYTPYKSDKTAPFKKESFSRLEQNKPEDLGNNISKLVENQELNMTPQQYWSLYGAMRGYPSFVRPNENMPNNRVYGPEENIAGMEDGGKVLKGQRGLSSGRFDIPFGAYMKAYFNKRSTPNVGTATNRSFGYSTSNGNEYYLEDANVGRNSVDTWVNVTPQKDTIIMQKLPSDHVNDLEDYQMEAIMQRMRPDIKRVNNQENGGNLKKKEDANVEMHQQKNKGRGKLSTPVSTTPKDSSKVEYNPSMQTLSFEDENGNNVTWTRNNFWGKPDGTYNWRSGRDKMFFNPNQNEGFIPYSRFKQWGTDIEGSTYLSPEDDARLKNLYEYARNKKTYIEPHYSWNNSIAERFWYWLKSLYRDKELTPGAPTFWEQTFKNGGKIK